MGQANRRGTFEERKAAAVVRNEKQARIDRETRERRLYAGRPTHHAMSAIMQAAILGAMAEKRPGYRYR